MFPLFLLITPVLHVTKSITNIVIGDVTSESLQVIKETLGIENPEKRLMESGFKNIEGQLGNIQSTILQQGQLLSNVQLGMTHQTAMLSAIQSSIGALGMATTAGCALSAVNLYQLLKIRKSLDRIEQKVDNGFLDLKIFLSEKLQDLLNEQQRQRLVQAYIYYRKGIEQLQSSLLIEDSVNRKLAVSNAISIFTQSFAVYDNKEEYAYINAPAKLRRLECCWAIQSSIAEAYCFQNEYRTALDCYQKLRDRIRTETQTLKEQMNPENFRFILNDLNWIYKNDLAFINDKISLLEDNPRRPQLSLISIDSAGKSEDFSQEIHLSTAKLYLDCLLSPQKLTNIKLSVLFSNRIARPVSLSDIDFCRLYTKDLLDQAEYRTIYLEPDSINTKFMLLIEDYFLKKFSLLLSAGYFFEKELMNPVEPWIKEDSHVVKLHQLSGSQNSIYEDIQYFNYAVKSYFASAVEYVRSFSGATSKDKKIEEQRLFKVSENLRLSKSFSSVINKALLDYSQQKKPECLKNQHDKVVNACLRSVSVKLSPNEEQTLSEFEKELLLTKEDILKNRSDAIADFIRKKNEVINKHPIHSIDLNNDVLIWEVQDTFSLKKKEEAKLFVKNCQLGVEQYLGILKTLSGNKLSDQSKAVLKEIQEINGFSDKFVAKILDFQRKSNS